MIKKSNMPIIQGIQFKILAVQKNTLKMHKKTLKTITDIKFIVGG